MKKIHFLVLPLLYILLSCNNKPQTNSPKDAQLDSLSERCYSLLMQLQTDSLRIAANNYMKATELYSKQYYKAKQYYINSYFNEKKYDKVLSLLDETSQLPHFNDYPSIACDYQYTRARAYQYSQQYPQAIETFKSCITSDCKDEKTQEQLQTTVLAAMTQLTNTYIISGNPEEGYRYFLQLKERPTELIRQYAIRDLYIHLSYIGLQAGYIEEAQAICDSAMTLSLYKPTPEKLFRDYSYASIVFYTNPSRKGQVIEWLNLALEEAEKNNYNSGIDWSIDLLASIYWETGRIEEGAELHFKALKIAKARKNRNSECNACISLSTYYLQWELYPQANDFANQAIGTIKNTDDNQFIGLAFNAKANVMKAMAMPDSAIYYFKKAESFLDLTNQPLSSRSSKIGMAELLIENHSEDSLKQGIQLVHDVLKSTKPNGQKSYYFYLYGKGLIKQGHINQGEAMLDSMYAETSKTPDIIYTDGVLEYLIDYYTEQKNSQKVMQYASLYRQQMKIRYDEKISRKVTTAVVQYQTEKKEQQLKLVTAELSIKNLRIKLYAIGAILLLLILIGVFLWHLHERKLHHSRQLLSEQEKLIALRECELAEVRLHEQERILNNALENLRNANRQSEQMHQQLNEFLSDQENKQRIASITPTLFREEGEVKFRRYFSQLYPHFLPKLKEQVPQITRSEEILCMLIGLEQNMDQIADILCIEKKSVKMSRYRLRKKVSFEEEESLYEFIKALME